MNRAWITVVVTAPWILAAAPTYAQRAAENAVNAAEDAFGVSVGNEAIGLYSASSARGFNPGQAGNIRVDGLYFDQQQAVPGPGRNFASTTVRVGLSAQSYPFPAPTGIVDMRLRHAGDRFGGSGVLTYGPYGNLQVDAEVSGPLIKDKLTGIASLSGFDTKNDSQAPYKMLIYGGSLSWTPNEAADIVVFTQGQTLHKSALQPFIFTVGGTIPPEYDRSVFFGQLWEQRHREINQVGLVATLRLFDDWLFHGGFFRSYHAPQDSFAFYRNVQSDGRGTFDLLRSPTNLDLSYSGEMRLSRSFTEGERYHTLDRKSVV